LEFGYDSISLDTVGVPSPNTWHMITATYDGQTMAIYIDGVKNTTTTHKGGIINVAGKGLIFIGNACKSVTTLEANAHLDEFAFWANRNLSASDISNLYDSGNGTFKTNVSQPSLPPEPKPENGTFYNVTVLNDLTVGGNAIIKFLGTLSNKITSMFVENANIVNLNVTGSAVFPHEISQPERDFNIVYLNNNSRPLMVYGSAFIVHETGADRARVVLKSDNETSPSTIIQNSGMDDMPSGVGKREMYFPFSMVVKPFEYYKIENSTTGSSSVSLDIWNEVEL